MPITTSASRSKSRHYRFVPAESVIRVPCRKGLEVIASLIKSLFRPATPYCRDCSATDDLINDITGGAVCRDETACVLRRRCKGDYSK